MGLGDELRKAEVERQARRSRERAEEELAALEVAIPEAERQFAQMMITLPDRIKRTAKDGETRLRILTGQHGSGSFSLLEERLAILLKEWAHEEGFWVIETDYEWRSMGSTPQSLSISWTQR